MAVSASCLVAVVHVTDRLDRSRLPGGIGGVDDPLKGPPSTLVVTQPTKQIAATQKAAGAQSGSPQSPTRCAVLAEREATLEALGASSNYRADPLLDRGRIRTLGPSLVFRFRRLRHALHRRSRE
jgi:hypothetical protein